MTNAKPIAVIYLPEDFVISPSDGESASMLLMKVLNGNYGDKDDPKIAYSDYWQQYYWFCFYKINIDAPEFKVFYDKDFTDVQFAELKQMIEDSIKQISETKNNQ